MPPGGWFVSMIDVPFGPGPIAIGGAEFLQIASYTDSFDVDQL
jgi:hypothetical protein